MLEILTLPNLQKAKVIAESLGENLQPGDDSLKSDMVDEAMKADVHAVASELIFTKHTKVLQDIKKIKFCEHPSMKGITNRVRRHLPKGGINFLTSV
jgi:hypothetical protein